MAIPTCIRPRSQEERNQLARLLCDAPAVVGIGVPDDGWLCASLRVAGREPVWVNDSDPAAAQAFLKRMGLPPLGTRNPEAMVGPGLKLDGSSSAPAQPLPGLVDGPLVTVLICTYNRADMLPYSIASAIVQRWPCEIVVVDDGSDDATPEILATTPGIRWFRQENSGKPGALERGLSEAKGEAVLVLDDDDILLPGALDVLAKALFSNPELSCVVGDTIIFDGKTGRPMSYRPAVRNPGSMALQSALQQIPGLPGASLIRMSAQRKAGAYEPELIRGQDMDMYLRLAQVGPIEAVPLPTFLYRSHDGLRGSAEHRFQKFDPRGRSERFLGFVGPTFERRYQDASPIQSRDDAHSWIMGLQLRDMNALARKEAQRWLAPHSSRERWVREQVGLSSQSPEAQTFMIVVDDGDPGALELTLHRHAESHCLWINLEVPRDPLGSLRLYWPGEYGARERLDQWVKAPGAWHMRLSSAPEWAPPPLPDPAWLPDLNARDALLAAAAALAWPTPNRTRNGLHTPLHPVTTAAWAARIAIEAGEPIKAMRNIVGILEAVPKWPGGWKLAADAHAAMGKDAEAAQCVARIDLRQIAARR